MKAIKTFTILVSIIILIGATVVLVPAEYFVLERKWSIEWGQKGTYLKLKKYELIGQPEELRTWLLEIDGAPGQEAFVNFIIWGLDHPDDFALIIGGLEPDRKPSLLVVLAGMIQDRKLENLFRKSFSEHTSSDIQTILGYINEYGQEN
ncbi:MAG: hypothetical protein ACRD6X_04130 [Pyrinomonadaceae bacterium]